MIALKEIIRQYPVEMQMPWFYDAMLKEYIHHHMLHFLFSGRYAGKIAFLGGTALRYFYDLKRFSEDLDFDCTDLTKDEFFQMTDKVNSELLGMGYQVMIDDKIRYTQLKAFRRVFVFPELKYRLGLSPHKEAKFFIKIEAEAQDAEYQPEIKTLAGFGVVSSVKCVPLSVLFSSKIAAALHRKKDRDFYDVLHLIDFAKPDYIYLEKKCGISTPLQLKESLLAAADEKQLSTRKEFDCEYALFDKNELVRIRSFSEYISAYDFDKFCF